MSGQGPGQGPPPWPAPEADEGDGPGWSEDRLVAEDRLDDSPPDVPGGRIFSLEGRKAPGLYLLAWILSVVGAVVTFVIGPLASAERDRVVLLAVGAIVLALGLATAAGYQVLERADRHPDRYRGPAPLLVFAAYFMAMSLIGLVLITVLGVDPDRPFSFLGIGVVQATGYLLVVWLFAVRSGALSWSDMGWPTWRGPAIGELVRGAGIAVLVILPVTMGLLILGSIVGLLLCTDAPQVLPLSETFTDGVFVVLAAAIIIPIGEEVFFRGFAQSAWTRDLGPRTALLRTTVFFALVHIANIDAPTFGQGLAQVVLTLVIILPVGYVLGWLFQRHGLGSAISGHITYNSLLLALAYAASRVPEPSEPLLRGWCQ